VLNGAENAKNTIIRHGAPSENDLMEVLGRHDGEVGPSLKKCAGTVLELEERKRVRVSQSPRTACE
jgi:hypothetical protein